MIEWPLMVAQMKVDWSIPIGTIMLFATQFVAGIVAIMRLIARVERSIDARLVAIDKSNDTRFSEIKMAMAMMKDGDMRELQGRIARLETGADEWTKALRERTHEHANEINTLKMEVDRLKRPMHYPPKVTE